MLLRSDGNPTYMLAVVVDDHDMGVTHIIRGDDHLTNAARQKQIYEALGWPVPIMAHIPLIHGPDGSKLSKRHGALGVDAYRALGYLPEALRNYLVRLGWSHGDQEIFSTREMIELFDLPQIGRSAARFDFVKLESLNGHYMRHMADAELLAALERALPYIAGGPELSAKLDEALRETLLKAMPGLKERAKTLVELLDQSRFIWSDPPLPMEDKAQALLTSEARALLRELLPHFEAISDWSAQTYRSCGARLCRVGQCETRLRRPAAPRRADRPRHLARNFRRADGPREDGKPCPHSPPGHEQRLGRRLSRSRRFGCPRGRSRPRKPATLPILQCGMGWDTPKALDQFPG